MSSRPTVVAQPCMCCVDGGGYFVGGTLVSGTTQQCTINTLYYCIRNMDTVAYATHSDYFIVIIIVITKAHQGHKG